MSEESRKSVLEIIENDHAVSDIRLNSGLAVWPLLRTEVYFAILKKTTNYSSQKRTRNKAQLFKNFFYGWTNLFKLASVDYLFFENTNKRIELNGRYYDVYFDAWADHLSRDRSLFIEFAQQKFLPRSNVHSKHIVSDLPFKFIGSVIGFFLFPKLKNKEIINEILAENEISLNVEKEIKSKLGEYYFYRGIFRIFRIKAVFVLSSFTKTNIVMAANSLGIKVFEAQHGFIGKHHPLYSAGVKFKNTYPDYLFAFGDYEKRKRFDNLIFEEDQILPIGGLQLEAIGNKPIPEKLISLKTDYNRIFCLTMQNIREDKLLEMVSEFALKNTKDLFVICPKMRSNDYSSYLEIPNIQLFPEYSVYDILKISDFNITIYSTTALEGELLGAKTILYNLDNFSRTYFDIDHLNAVVIEEDENLNNDILNKFSFENNPPYYRSGFLENVKNTTLDI